MVEGYMDYLVAIIFAVSIAAIVSRVVDESVAALAGVVLMVILTDYTPLEAFSFIDWNVLAILLGMWIITGYMIEGNIPELIMGFISRRVRSYGGFILSMALVSGFLSMFVDNVLVILLFGSIVLRVALKAGVDPFKAVMLIGVSANFMGTALLMGDLPPQLLHSVAGAEFLDFIYFRGKPSSFPLLTLTFIVVTVIAYRLYFRGVASGVSRSVPSVEGYKSFNIVSLVSLTGFSATVVGMALRPLLGVPLGFITMTGAMLTALIFELLRRVRGDIPDFEKVLGHVEWRALLFYASLFSLVGGLESASILENVAKRFLPLLESSTVTSYTIFYWISGALSTFIEHDALLLTFLYIVKDASVISGLDVWHVYWALVWSATLGSNATVAAAPALYVALTLVEGEAGVRVKPAQILRFTLPYIAISLAVHYIISLPVWGVGS